MTQTGICRLCGKHDELTKEHIPAKGGYKGMSYRVQVLSGDAVLEGGRGKQYQNGFHADVLCDDCNNCTGAWYGTEYARFTKWGLSILELLRQGQTHGPPYRGRPARIAKQIISTMIAASEEGFADDYPRFREFVLDPDKKLTPDELGLGMYICPTRTGRSTGVAKIWKPEERPDPHVMIEYALQPFGYVLTLQGEPFDTQPASIATFGSYGFDEESQIDLTELPILPTHLAVPCDWRSANAIREDVIFHTLDEQGHSAPREEAQRIMASGKGPEFFKRHGEDWSLAFETGLADQ